MDKEKIEKVAGMLESASNLLKESLPQSRPGSSGIQNGSQLQSALDHARTMIRTSTASGTCRRLNRTERLRSTAPVNISGRKKQPPRNASKKALECALLKCFGDASDEGDQTLKWDSVIAQGIVLLSEQDDERAVREAIKELLINKFPIIGANDFDFVKVKQKKILRLELGAGAEYNFSVVKKLCGQGLLYVKVKEGYEFLYEEDDSNQNDLDDKVLNSALDDEVHNTKIDETKINDAPIHPDDAIKNDETESKDIYDEIIDIIDKRELTDPVEMLRLLQQKLVKGRKLDVSSADLAADPSVADKATNYICVDRDSILKTTFAELESIEDFSITFEVNFMGEVAKDYGGPRKEWIRLMNAAIKEKYFDRGLREFLANEYFYVGVMIGIALLQNGQLPAFLPHDVCENLLHLSSDQCIVNLQKGLDKFGMYKIMQRAPILLHLLRPTDRSLTSTILLQLLSPLFAPEGCTARSREKEVYGLFIKYVREVSSGRRNQVNLSSILAFATGAAEEPVLGFEPKPIITFVQSSSNVQTDMSYFPTAHTCSNNLVLPRGPLIGALPSDEKVFEIYDHAFANQHFGAL